MTNVRIEIPVTRSLEANGQLLQLDGYVIYWPKKLVFTYLLSEERFGVYSLTSFEREHKSETLIDIQLFDEVYRAQNYQPPTSLVYFSYHHTPIAYTKSVREYLDILTLNSI